MLIIFSLLICKILAAGSIPMGLEFFTEHPSQIMHNQNINEQFVRGTAEKYLVYLYNGGGVDTENPYSDSLYHAFKIEPWGGGETPVTVIDTFYVQKIVLSRKKESYEIKVKYIQFMKVGNDMRIVEGRRIIIDSFRMKDSTIIDFPKVLFTGREGMIIRLHDLMITEAQMNHEDSLKVEELLLKLRR